MLQNKAYLGIRVYSTKDGGWEETKAAWPAIIAEDIFDHVQKLLKKNRWRRMHLEKRHPYLISGICLCAACGERLSGRSAHSRGNKVTYYEHSQLAKNQAALKMRLAQCEPPRIRAHKIEPLVWKETKAFLLSPDTAKRLQEVALADTQTSQASNEVDRLKKKVRTIEQQIENLAERISRLPKGVEERPFYDQMTKLQAARGVAEQRLVEAKDKLKAPDEIISYEDFSKFTGVLKALLGKAEENTEIQSEIIHKVVQKITVNKRASRSGSTPVGSTIVRSWGQTSPPDPLFHSVLATPNTPQNQSNEKLVPRRRTRPVLPDTSFTPYSGDILYTLIPYTGGQKWRGRSLIRWIKSLNSSLDYSRARKWRPFVGNSESQGRPAIKSLTATNEWASALWLSKKEHLRGTQTSFRSLLRR